MNCLRALANKGGTPDSFKVIFARFPHHRSRTASRPDGMPHEDRWLHGVPRESAAFYAHAERCAFAAPANKATAANAATAWLAPSPSIIRPNSDAPTVWPMASARNAIDTPVAGRSGNARMPQIRYT